MNTATHFLPITLGGLVVLAICAVFAEIRDGMWRATARPVGAIGSGRQEATVSQPSPSSRRATCNP